MWQLLGSPFSLGIQGDVSSRNKSLWFWWCLSSGLVQRWPGVLKMNTWNHWLCLKLNIHTWFTYFRIVVYSTYECGVEDENPTKKLLINTKGTNFIQYMDMSLIIHSLLSTYLSDYYFFLNLLPDLLASWFKTNIECLKLPLLLPCRNSHSTRICQTASYPTAGK